MKEVKGIASLAQQLKITEVLKNSYLQKIN